MRNLSSEFKQNQNNGNRNYLKFVDITLKNGTELHLDNRNLWSNGFSFEDAVSTDDNFDIGSAIINKFTITINNMDDGFSDYIFEEANVVVYVGLALSAGTEKIRICTGTVTEAPYQNSSIITLTCEDNMLKFDRDYSGVATKFPATRLKIVQDICTTCGVTLQTKTFLGSDYMVQTRPNDEALTCRQMLAWVAQIGCQWCKCDEYGRLCLEWYNTNPTETDYVKLPGTNGLTANIEDVVITGVRVMEFEESTTEESNAKSYLYGKSGYVLEVSGNKLIPVGTGNTIASTIGQRCVGMRFRPFNANCLTDIAMEAGDPVKIVDRKGKTYTSYLTSVNLNPGNFERVSCGAKTAARNSAKQYSIITQVETDARNNVKKEKTEREKALEELAQRIENSEGVFTTVEKTESGGKIFYLHNKPNLSDSDMIWKMTAEAWAVSTDGGKTWNAGMTVDGDTIVRILTATGVNADWINTGRLEVKDSNGNTLFLVDMDTKEVNIDGNHLRIGGKPLEQLIMDTKTIILSLDNYYQSVGVDKDGKYTKFPVIKVKPKVNYGLEDITDLCEFTTTESDNVTGTWDIRAKTYTVTGLTADNGWVDISATYLGRFMDTKRFTLAKVYAGAEGPPGKDGRTYILESSAQVIKVAKNNRVIPSYIDFYSKYQDGQSANRHAYKGRFRIRETADGKTWKTVYESAKDETSVRHNLYTFILTNTGNPILASNGKAISIYREIAQIEVTLYAAGGFTTMIDIQNIVTVKDVDNLSPEQVFDILTDNGKVQGIYKEGGQIYVNGEFIQARGFRAVDRNGKVTFYINDNGEVTINARSLSISGQVGATQEYANGKAEEVLTSSKEYSDSKSRETLSSATKYADSSSDKAVKAQTQEFVFNKLTKNGTVQAIKMDENGNIYINASYINAGVLSANYIKTGILQDANANFVMNMETGNVSIKKGTINLGGNFIATSDGTVTLKKGSISANLINSGTMSADRIFGGTIKGTDFISEKGSEWFKIAESVATGGYGSTMDGLLDLSAQYESARNVVLEARTYNLVFKAPHSKEIRFESGMPIFYDPSKFYDEVTFYKASKMFGLRGVTSGSHIVYESDGATLAFLASSSHRYKNHVREMKMEEAFKALNIPVVWFKYKEGYLNPEDRFCDKPIPGFYAEDVLDYFPEAAQLNIDGKAEDWNYRVMIPIMMKLIQHLYEREENHDENI